MNESEQLVRELTTEQARKMLAAPTRSERAAQRYRQLAAALHACETVSPVPIFWTRINGAMLLEAFTRDGVGTMVSGNTYDATQTTIDDVSGILELIEPLEAEGILVRRSRDKLEQEMSFVSSSMTAPYWPARRYTRSRTATTWNSPAWLSAQPTKQ